MGLHILQFGRTGQVGLELLARGPLRGHRITALGRDTVDLADPASVKHTMASARDVDVVINGAAYTAVDKAESEPDLAMRVNAESVGELAQVCAARGLPLIHLSTDYVFDGRKAEPYREDDPTNPQSVYGRSKLQGEIAVRERLPRHVILRTSWVYSPFGTNFVKTMLRLGAERDELRIVDDQHGSPTAAGDIALAFLTIAERAAQRDETMRWGTYHYTAAGETTWYRFAEAIFSAAGAWAKIKAKIVAIPSSEYKTQATRPLNSRLDCTKIARELGVTPRAWREALGQVLAEIKNTTEAGRR
jgi:dTDP-4-dehydrorhamnose reductase